MSMAPSVRIDNLFKEYRIGVRSRLEYCTLRETLAEFGATAWRRWRGLSDAPIESRDSFLALDDVSFEVQPGEVLGIIGRNGAGKSTLLKILSRITEPTRGRVEMRGRIASLLEVGTGFHPELTGRENVYMNGSILGMSRREISNRFDEIVAFAEIDQFLDTPVKRYSSGMYVRLAFAVAAHLNPEILVVDEVLAVGDASFQQKCLGRMRSVAAGGRTVLFVSHNVGTIQTLCNKVLIMERGRLLSLGSPRTEINRYLSLLAPANVQLDARIDRDGTGEVQFTGVDIIDCNGAHISAIPSGHDLMVMIHYRRRAAGPRLTRVALSIFSSEGRKICHVDNYLTGTSIPDCLDTTKLSCTIPKIPLPPGRYSCNAMLSTLGGVSDHVANAAAFDVIPGDYYGIGRETPSCDQIVFVKHHWCI